MTDGNKKEPSFHGGTTQGWLEAHARLSDSPHWRALALRGVIEDRGAFSLLLGCPECGSTFTKPSSPETVLEVVTDASQVSHRSFELLSSALVRLNKDVPKNSNDAVTALSQQAAEASSGNSAAMAENEGDGWFICPCGIEGQSGAIEPCDQDGFFCEPSSDDGWAGHVKCAECRRFWHQDVCKVLGFGPPETQDDYHAACEAGILSHARLANFRRAIQTCQPEGGAVEIRDDYLSVRRCAGAAWEQIGRAAGHSVEFSDKTVLLRRDGQVVLSVTRS